MAISQLEQAMATLRLDIAETRDKVEQMDALSANQRIWDRKSLVRSC